MNCYRLCLLASLGTLTIVLCFVRGTHAFKVRIHEAVTANALDGIVTGPRSAEEIEANKRTDTGNLTVDEYHFDDELFSAGGQALADRVNAAISSALDQCDKAEALERFGSALHSLQDFFAHSNWVENLITSGGVAPDNVTFFADLVTRAGSGMFTTGLLVANGAFTTSTGLVCAPDPGPPFGYDLTRISSGYFPSAPGGKCGHGVGGGDGLNNDDDTPQNSRGAFAINGFTLRNRSRACGL